MNIGIWQLVILALVVLVLFGRGRISEMMGDFGKGIKSFKQGMNEEADRPAPPRIEQQVPVPPATVAPAAVPTAQQAQQVQARPQQAQQGAGQPMSYDPVSAPPSTDPHPPHPHVGGSPASSAPQQQAMPYDPVTAPATVGDAGQRG